MVVEVKGLDIKTARLKISLHQYEVAAWLGILASPLSDIESGRRKPSPELTERLLQVFDESSDG